MYTSYERTLHGGLNPGRTRTLSRLDEVGAVVRLRARLTNPVDEDMDSAEGDPVPVLNRVGVGALAFIVDVDLAATTLGHPAHCVSLEPFEVALQELKSTVRWPHGGCQLSWNCHARCPRERT